MESDEKRNIHLDMSTETSRRCCCIVDVDWSNMYASPADIRQYLIRLNMLIKDYFPARDTHVRAWKRASVHTHKHTYTRTQSLLLSQFWHWNRLTTTCAGLANCFSTDDLLWLYFFFAFCLLLLTASVAGIACRACQLSGTFLSLCHKHRQRRRHSYTQTRTHTHTHTHTHTDDKNVLRTPRAWTD